MDDDHVSSAQLTRVQQQQAYVLFYRPVRPQKKQTTPSERALLFLALVQQPCTLGRHWAMRDRAIVAVRKV